jgi:hypothetical protein
MTGKPLFQKATRTAQKLKIGLTGPSGAGKTFGGLALAQQLAQGARFAVIDTENGSASLYADRFGFDTLELQPPYLTAKYTEAVQAAIDAGYSVVLIDSISHQWDGDGGILQRKEEVDARGGNHFSNWQPFTKEHNAFRAMLLHAPVHLVATMRSKMAYSQEEGGKKQVKKVGLQPIQRDGMEYEFTLTFDLQMDHKAAASKDRTGLFVGKLTDLTSPKTGEALLDWLSTAEPLPATWSEAERTGLAREAQKLQWSGQQFKEFVIASVGHYPPNRGTEAEHILSLMTAKQAAGAA